MVSSRRVRWGWAVLGWTVLGASSAWAATVTVFAAASLTEAFRTIGKDFEAAHPGTKVDFNFAGSSTLARQIVEGAPADVFASADDENMRKVVDAGDVAGVPQSFVHNRLAIIVPRGQPEARQEPSRPSAPRHDHLARGARRCRSAATPRRPSRKANTPVPDASREADVKAVVTRVSMGEADAGVVYVTDVAAGGEKIEAVPIEEAQNVVASYPIATLKGAPNAAGARDFIAYVLSPPGQRVLTHSGFLAP